MQLVDTHCHIQSIGATEGERHTKEIWAKDASLTPEDVISRSKEADVTKLICVGCDLGDSRQAIEFAAKYPETWASIGIHPHEAKDYANNPDAQAEFKALVQKPKVVAVGECGLDYFYGHSPKEDQIEVLKMQLELAALQSLPVIFHVREALDDFWPIFDMYPRVRGVMHSYTDNMANLEEGLKRGLYFGVNGIATFAKDPDQIEVYKQIPLNHLLLETDSPFLTPNPYRGTINEPNKVGTIAKFMAELKSEELTILAAATTENAVKLFGI